MSLCVSLYYFDMKTAFPSNIFIRRLVLGSRETIKKMLNKNVYSDVLYKTWIFKQFRYCSTFIKFKGAEQVMSENNSEHPNNTGRHTCTHACSHTAATCAHTCAHNTYRYARIYTCTNTHIHPHILLFDLFCFQDTAHQCFLSLPHEGNWCSVKRTL